MDNIEEAQEWTKLLVERALRNEHTEFEFIRSFDELLASYKCKKAIKTVARSFAKTGRNILKTYLNSIKNDEENLDLLFSYKQIKTCQDFYEKDAAIVADMISEYNCYLRYGHLAKSILLGHFRPDEELMDWRKLPIGW